MRMNLFRKVLSLLLAVTVYPFLLTACSSEVSYSTEAGKIVINEVMSSNSAFAPSADGKFYDWVELRNTTEETISLDGYYISDDDETPLKTSLEGITLEPDGYAVIYLSGKDMVDEAGCHHAAFKLSSAGEVLTLSDRHGDIVSRLSIPESPENVSFGLNEDGKAVWFAIPTPGGKNSADFAEKAENIQYHSNGVIVNEYMNSNKYVLYDGDSDFCDWVELCNPTVSDADMTGYHLSDSSESASKWTFPDGTVIPAGGYLLVFLSGKDKVDSAGYLHTGFSLGDEDEGIFLFTQQGVIASSLENIDLPENTSCGLNTSGEVSLFGRPTPGRANATASFSLDMMPASDINDGVYINEALSVSSGKSAWKNDWIELYNSTPSAVSLDGYRLACGLTAENMYTFSDVIIEAGQYLLVNCGAASENTDDLNTQFKLDAGGEKLYLLDAVGKVCDCFSTGKSINGMSSGRCGGDLSQRFFFSEPTPGSENTGERFEGYCPQPVFSRMSGYAEEGEKIELSCTGGFEIYYTTNGSVPDKNSTLYTEPIAVNGNTCVRAVCCSDGLLDSQCVTETFITDEKHDISVVCLTSSHENLFSQEKGILCYANLYNELEVPAYFEFIEPDGTFGVGNDAGISLFGADSRALFQVGLHVAFREMYGAGEINYPLFPRMQDGLMTFDSLLLRPSGEDQTRAKLRDELGSAVMRGNMAADYQEFRSCALYINGEYRGLYYIRERLDDDYIYRHYGVDKGSIDLVKSQINAQAGDMDEYYELMRYVRQHDMNDDECYDYVCSQIDMTSLCDYWIIETYLCNIDTGNIRCWRADGEKWHWMVYDLDWGMIPETWMNNQIRTQLIYNGGHGSNLKLDNSLMSGLMKSERFRKFFISRCCYHLNTTFAPERTTVLFKELKEDIVSELPRQYERWHCPAQGKWESEWEFIERFLNEKPDIYKKHLMDAFDLNKRELKVYLRDNRSWNPENWRENEL